MHESPPVTSYVYVIVRSDLPPQHITVQAAHAAIAATNTFEVARGMHPHLVVCQVANERELDAAFNRLKKLGVPCCAWYEDDMNNSLTAIATGLLRGSERKTLRRFKLLTSANNHNVTCASVVSELE